MKEKLNIGDLLVLLIKFLNIEIQEIIYILEYEWLWIFADIK